jgi:hypothetical protein
MNEMTLTDLIINVIILFGGVFMIGVGVIILKALREK